MQTSPFQNSSDDLTGSGTEKPRKPYKAPRLTSYGNVAVLTQSGSSITTETTKTSRSSRKPSDFRLKENIVRIGNHPLGFGLYLFDYRAPHSASYGNTRQFGVIAQEVESIVPAAVSLNAEGFRQVDYTLLGITLH